jgi:hypothetical protein
MSGCCCCCVVVVVVVVAVVVRGRLEAVMAHKGLEADRLGLRDGRVKWARGEGRAVERSSGAW